MNVSMFDVLTLIAILIGPIAAVVVTRQLDNRNATYARRYQVFRDLVRTRSAKLSPEHVNALNLVEIEFSQYTRVKGSWSRYMDSLSSRVPMTEATSNDHLLRRDQLFIKLVQDIANVLGMRHVDITDVMTTNYYPQGWQTDEEEQRQLRQLLISFLSGNHPIPVRLHDTSQWNGPFPPLLRPKTDKVKMNGTGHQQ